MRAIALSADHRRVAKIKRARAAYDAGQPADAIRQLEALLASGPPDIEALATLGSARLAMQDMAGAIQAYTKAATLAPDVAALALLVGHAYKGARRPAEACRWYKKATELDADDAENWVALAWAVRELGHPDEALACCARAKALDPTLVEIGFVEACCLHNLGRYEESLAAFDALAQTNPESDAIGWNRAVMNFLLGRWDTAWPIAERRHEVPKRIGHFRPLPGRVWTGEPLEGRTVFVQLEQGLGDQVQFLRFCRDIKARGGRVVFECSRPLAPIIATSPYVDEIVLYKETPPSFDVCVDLMSLPLVLGTGSDLRADALPAFAAPGTLPDAIRAACDVPEARVGLVWGGEPRHFNDRNRSIGLAPLTPLLQIPGIRWFSLQKGIRERELLELPADLRERVTDLAPLLGDFGDTAHAVQQLDLVITVDTSVAHIAASLGVPTWVLLPFVPDWRWTGAGDETGWYPAARLWRQTTRGDWTSVVRDLGTMLRAGLEDAQRQR